MSEFEDFAFLNRLTNTEENRFRRFIEIDRYDDVNTLDEWELRDYLREFRESSKPRDDWGY